MFSNAAFIYHEFGLGKMNITNYNASLYGGNDYTMGVAYRANMDTNFAF